MHYYSYGGNTTFAWTEGGNVTVNGQFTNEYIAEIHEWRTTLVDGGNNRGVSAVCNAARGLLNAMMSVHTSVGHRFSRPTQFADSPETYETPVAVHDPMPAYAAIPPHLPGCPLLSNRREQFGNRCRRMPPVCPPRALRMQGTVRPNPPTSAPNPNTCRRNNVAEVYGGRTEIENRIGNSEESSGFGAVPNRYRKPDVKCSNADPKILRNVEMQGTVGYAPNPNTSRSNQVSSTLQSCKVAEVDGARRGIDNRIGNSEDGSGLVTVPKRYAKDVKYLKAGIDDAELEQVNKSGLSGLEATLPNSYCNSMIQLLFFTESFRSVVLGHQCGSELCVTCELGFLFHMLGSGAPCHSGNLLRALRSSKKASALRLILSDSSDHEANFVSLIQNWNRFILYEVHYELLECKRKGSKAPTFVHRDVDFPSINLQNQRKRKIMPELTDELVEDTTNEETEVSRLFASKQTHVFTCLKCQNKSSKEATLLVHNLDYNIPKGDSSVSFPEVVEGSVGGSQMTPAWCKPCNKFRPTRRERKVKSLPQILSINCGNSNESDKKFWRDQIDAVVRKDLQGSGGIPASGNNNWLPMCLDMHLSATGEVRVAKHGVEIKQENEFANKVIYTYDLYGVVCYINDERKNLVSIVNVNNEQSNAGEPQNPKWFIFNDFSITPVPCQEAVWFSMDWKIPCVLYFKQRTNMLTPCVTTQISPNVLINVPKYATITPLSPEEVPKRGDLVAIDAEFVTLKQEILETSSDGKFVGVRPKHLSAARISCVRGQGELEGTAFIDDYISTQEQVYDYVTEFSGIQPGDLDATRSKKNLTSLKSTYSKIRYLIDNGVIFVGHGLNNDFRVLNVVVPPEQVIDTVKLFYLPDQRMVSLRFLSWHYLGIKIQCGSHDSVDDARAALRLYQKYVELETQGILQSSLKAMYVAGKAHRWKVPELENDA